MSDLLDRALAKVSIAHRELTETIGALEMANRTDDRSTLAGYTGNSALNELRKAVRGVALAKEKLESLNPKEAVRP